MKKVVLSLALSIFSIISTAQCNINISWTSSVAGSNITFTNTSTGVPSNPAFAWLYDGQSSSVENPTFPYDSLITEVCFAITDLDSTACQDSICGPLINVDSCDLNIMWISNIVGGTITFTNTSTGMPSNPSFAWLYDGQSSSIENPSFPYDSTVSQVCFAIYDIDNPSCEDSICGGLDSDSTAAIKEISELLNIQIYPNPAASQITILIPEGSSTYNIQVIDLTGRVLVTSIISNNIGDLDIAHLENGGYLIYIFEDSNNEHFTVRKIVKQ